MDLVSKIIDESRMIRFKVDSISQSEIISIANEKTIKEIKELEAEKQIQISEKIAEIIEILKNENN